MGNDEFGLHFPIANVLQQLRHVALGVGLPHFKNQALFKSIAEQKSVDKTGINARHAHNTAAARGSNALTQRLAAGAFKLQVRHHSFQGTALGLKTNSINGCVHPMKVSPLQNRVRRVIVSIKVDWNDAVGVLRKL